MAEYLSCAIQELLAEVGAGPWETLAKRRVQHFGYKFEYWVRGQHIIASVVSPQMLISIQECQLERVRSCLTSLRS